MQLQLGRIVIAGDHFQYNQDAQEMLEIYCLIKRLEQLQNIYMNLFLHGKKKKL